MGDKIEKVVYIEVPKEELKERIKLRAREDDTPEVVEKRFAIIEQNIYSIISLLKAKNISTVVVNGLGTIEEVTERLRLEVENL